eukprot:15460003-Alexandrium_andersonii.AAC.1
MGSALDALALVTRLPRLPLRVGSCLGGRGAGLWPQYSYAPPRRASATHHFQPQKRTRAHLHTSKHCLGRRVRIPTQARARGNMQPHRRAARARRCTDTLASHARSTH